MENMEHYKMSEGRKKEKKTVYFHNGSAFELYAPVDIYIILFIGMFIRIPLHFFTIISP